MSAYPTDFPCPLIEPTAYEAVPGVVRTVFENGLTRQRRIHGKLPRIFKLAFMIRQSPLYGRWLNWADKTAWSGFTIQLPSDIAGTAGLELTDHSMRFIDDLRTELVRTSKGYYWRVDVTAEVLS